MKATVNNMGQIGLRILDPEFAMIASQAAIEIDNYILEKPTSYKSVKILAQFLIHSFDKPTESIGKLNFDSNAVSIVGRAFSASGKRDKVKTVSKLFEETRDIAQRLNNEPINGDRLILEQMRAFCVALANCASSYQQSIQDLKPANPYRR